MNITPDAKFIQKRIKELEKDLELAQSCTEISYFENEIYLLEQLLKG